MFTALTQKTLILSCVELGWFCVELTRGAGESQSSVVFVFWKCRAE